MPCLKIAAQVASLDLEPFGKRSSPACDRNSEPVFDPTEQVHRGHGRTRQSRTHAENLQSPRVSPQLGRMGAARIHGTLVGFAGLSMLVFGRAAQFRSPEMIRLYLFSDQSACESVLLLR